jgi:hypothetical protein
MVDAQGNENLAALGTGIAPHRPYDLTATAAGVTFTWTANDPGVTTGAATIADGDTVGDDNDAGDALSALEDQVNKLVADVEAMRAVLVSLGIATTS